MFFPMLSPLGISRTRVGHSHATVTQHYIGPHNVPKWLSTVDYVRKATISIVECEDEYLDVDTGMVECSEIDCWCHTRIRERE